MRSFFHVAFVSHVAFVHFVQGSVSISLEEYPFPSMDKMVARAIAYIWN